jgi:hypothetical protein
MVIKLDFAKAFDTVNWDALDSVLHARGFSHKWRRWMSHILQSSKSAVLVNGCPGPWINCKRGLRQGDPISPYLFILLADVLQVLIRKETSIGHPIVDGEGCAVLQYADDTLLMVRGQLADIQALKNILDQFASATGLQINYSKSTAVPIYMDEGTVQECISALGCRREGFPQTYLGLPLSNTKLRLNAFAPQIAKTDKYLSGWQTSLLNQMGRATLVNSVLDSQLVYAMCALPIPPGVIEQVDKRRRCFLWSGSGAGSGANNLIAWDRVCDTKETGGLGLKDLRIQNTCLLLKLVHKLHSEHASSWARWVQNNASVASLTGDLHGQHWDMLRSILPIYRAITTVILGDGKNTSFWHDVWDGDDSMADRFPELYSHCRTQEMTVRQATEGGLQNSLVTRRSAAATMQLSQLSQIMELHSLGENRDRRLSPLLKRNGDLDTSMLYKTLKTANSSPDTWAKFVWNNKAPPRVKFFAWLLSKGRIQCKTNLIKKGIVHTSDCDVCHGAEETAAHVVFRCPAAREFWEAVGIHVDSNWEVQKLQEIRPPPHIPQAHFGTFLLLCCWHIWKRRNNTVFRDDRTTLAGALAACKTEANLWRVRLPRKDRQTTDAWCSILTAAM